MENSNGLHTFTSLPSKRNPLVTEDKDTLIPVPSFGALSMSSSQSQWELTLPRILKFCIRGGIS